LAVGYLPLRALDYAGQIINILTNVGTVPRSLAVAVNAAAKADKSQERFYDALRDLFVGAAGLSFIVDSYLVLRLGSV